MFTSDGTVIVLSWESWEITENTLHWCQDRGIVAEMEHRQIKCYQLLMKKTSQILIFSFGIQMTLNVKNEVAHKKH